MRSRRRFAWTIAIATLVPTLIGAKDSKATKVPVAVTFEAHNEGSGEIYGPENVVTVTIDKAGFRYQGKGMDKPSALTWEQLSGWQPNRFTSYPASRPTGGDFGIGIYQGVRYFSFRTHNGLDFTAAVKALRFYAQDKERTGMG